MSVVVKRSNFLDITQAVVLKCVRFLDITHAVVLKCVKFFTSCDVFLVIILRWLPFGHQ